MGIIVGEDDEVDILECVGRSPRSLTKEGVVEGDTVTDSDFDSVGLGVTALDGLGVTGTGGVPALVGSKVG